MSKRRDSAAHWLFYQSESGAKKSWQNETMDVILGAIRCRHVLFHVAGAARFDANLVEDCIPHCNVLAVCGLYDLLLRGIHIGRHRILQFPTGTGYFDRL